MYELLILSILRNRDMSGYKLGQVLESSLVPRREISNGVIYPLLNRLEENGDILVTEKSREPRNKKMAHITELGEQHFQELMRLPVANDAKRESTYRFKFRGMVGVDKQTQQQILNDYAAAVQSDLTLYQRDQAHLRKQIQTKNGNVASLRMAVKALDLSTSICQTKQSWIKEYRQELEHEGE